MGERVILTGWTERSANPLIYPGIVFPIERELLPRYAKYGEVIERDLVFIGGVYFNIRCFKKEKICVGCGGIATLECEYETQFRCGHNICDKCEHLKDGGHGKI